jgi:hypothetical protein
MEGLQELAETSMLNIKQGESNAAAAAAPLAKRSPKHFQPSSKPGIQLCR